MILRPILLALLLLGGCAATPPARFYTLSGPPSPAATASGPSVVVGPVAIPAVVDRPEIVITISENEVWLDEFNRWASPLADAVGLAATENLAALLGTPRVTLLAQSASAGADADFRVTIEVQRFESAPGSYALLDALYSVRRTSDGRSVSGRTTDRQSVSDKSYDALAAAHSRAVARLARDATDALRTLAAQPAGRAAPSPAR